MRKPNCSCSECGASIYRRPNQLKSNVFCSSVCANVRNKKPEKKCGICQAVVLQMRRAKYCSKLCANEAIRRLPRGPRTEKPRNWRRLLVIERGGKCNRCPVNFIQVLQVHHILERCNGGTDELENLEVLCPTCHAIHHYNMRVKGKLGESGLNLSVAN